MKNISIHATERNQKRVYNLNLIFDIAGNALKHENDRTDGDAIAKYVHSKFPFQSTPDGIHIQPMEHPLPSAPSMKRLQNYEDQRHNETPTSNRSRTTKWRVIKSSYPAG